MDKKAPPELRASVQGFFAFLTWGVGWLIGSLLTGVVLQTNEIKDNADQIVGHHWTSIMLVPASIALVVTVLFAVLFESEKEKLDISEEHLV